MKESTRRGRIFAIIDVIYAALVCCYFAETWYCRISVVIAALISGGLVAWDLIRSKGEWYNDYMYLYFQAPAIKDKRDAVTENDRKRRFVRIVIVIGMFYLCIVSVYLELTISRDLSIIEHTLIAFLIVIITAPINMIWIWKMESKMSKQK